MGNFQKKNEKWFRFWGYIFLELLLMVMDAIIRIYGFLVTLAANFLSFIA